MKCKILVLFIAFTLLLSILTYADIPKFNYSFEEAAKMALDNTPELKELDITIKKASDYYDYLDHRIPSTVKFNLDMKIFLVEQVDPQTELETAYKNYQMLVLAKNNLKRNLQLGLREAVIGIEKAEMAVKEAEINKKAINNQLTLLEIQKEEGMVSKNDYQNKKRELDDNLRKIDDVNNVVDMAYRQLNILLGRKDDKDIAIKLDDTLVPMEKLDLEQIKKDMAKFGDSSTGSSPSMLKGSPGSLRVIKEDRDLYKSRYSLIEERYDKYNLDKLTEKKREDIEEIFEDAKKDYEVADKKYNNALIRFDKTFDDMIEHIEDLCEDIEDIKREIEDEKINKTIYRIKYDAGLMPKIEYESLREKIVLLENKLKNAELDLNMNYAKLLIYSDLKKVVLE